MLKIPFSEQVVVGASPITTNLAIASDYITRFVRLYAVVTLTQAATHETVISVNQATAVAGTGAKALAKVVPIWAIDDVSASDILARQADAVSFTVADTETDKIVVIQIDGEDLDVNNGFDCISIGISASSEATNIASIMFIATPRYPGVSMVTD